MQLFGFRVQFRVMIPSSISGPTRDAECLGVEKEFELSSGSVETPWRP
jgi:hypothetical protein